MSTGGRLSGAKSARRGSWRRGAAALAVFALLSQTLIILIHRPSTAMLTDAQLAVTIEPTCPMVLGGSPTPASDEPGKAPERKPSPVCPICQSLQLSGVFLQPS